MRFYLKYLFTFLKAAAISLLFGVCWASTFFGFDYYIDIYMRHLRNDFFFDIIVFFFSGIIGALLFLVVMRLFEKLFATISPQS
jgi:hypothetical protein